MPSYCKLVQVSLSLLKFTIMGNTVPVDNLVSIVFNDFALPPVGQMTSFKIVIIFSEVVCRRCLLHHILSLIAYTFRENREFVFIIIVQFMMSANIRIRFGLQIVLVCLYNTPSHYHHCVNLSEGIELINACQIHFVECVSKIKHILSVIHYTTCGAVCFQFTHFSCDDCENIYTLSYYHHQIGSMNYYPLFRVRSWYKGVRCMSFYILMTDKIWYYHLGLRALLPKTTQNQLCRHCWHCTLS